MRKHEKQESPHTCRHSPHDHATTDRDIASINIKANLNGMASQTDHG